MPKQPKRVKKAARRRVHGKSGAASPPSRDRLHIIFTDMSETNKSAHRSMQERVDRLNKILEDKEGRALSEEEQDDLENEDNILKVKDAIVDPLFVAIRGQFKDNDNKLGVTVVNPSDGKYDVTADHHDDVLRVAAVYGLLAADKVEPPSIVLKGRHTASDPTDPRFDAFSQKFFNAYGEMDAKWPMLQLVFPILRNEGDNPDDGVKEAKVSAIELMRVLRELEARRIKTDEPQLRRRVNEALDSLQSVGSEQPPSKIGIDLPDLEAQSDYAIVANNIRALQPIYFAAMFEELKVFQVRDKLAEQFQNGILPVGVGHAGDVLYSYWRETAKRMSEAERRSFYSRTLGIPGGDDGGMPNREFSDLWLRFISAVSSYVRQNNVDRLLRSELAAPVSDQMVRKSARDLAVNLSLHGYGMAYWVATELQKEIVSLIDLLSDRDIMSAYGARDMWQVIDQVASLELGGPRNSVKYRTMATSGAIIMAWLATNAEKLGRSSYSDELIRIQNIRRPSPLRSGQKATVDPRDYDLANACDQWLAVTGTGDSQVEEYAQPREAPTMTAKPIAIPAIARDMLESAGVPAMSLGRSGRYQN